MHFFFFLTKRVEYKEKQIEDFVFTLFHLLIYSDVASTQTKAYHFDKKFAY